VESLGSVEANGDAGHAVDICHGHCRSHFVFLSDLPPLGGDIGQFNQEQQEVQVLLDWLTVEQVAMCSDFFLVLDEGRIFWFVLEVVRLYQLWIFAHLHVNLPFVTFFAAQITIQTPGPRHEERESSLPEVFICVPQMMRTVNYIYNRTVHTGGSA